MPYLVGVAVDGWLMRRFFQQLWRAAGALWRGHAGIRMRSRWARPALGRNLSIRASLSSVGDLDVGQRIEAA
jgi:hypothetical protein